MGEINICNRLIPEEVIVRFIIRIVGYAFLCAIVYASITEMIEYVDTKNITGLVFLSLLIFLSIAFVVFEAYIRLKKGPISADPEWATHPFPDILATDDPSTNLHVEVPRSTEPRSGESVPSYRFPGTENRPTVSYMYVSLPNNALSRSEGSSDHFPGLLTTDNPPSYSQVLMPSSRMPRGGDGVYHSPGLMSDEDPPSYSQISMPNSREPRSVNGIYHSSGSMSVEDPPSYSQVSMSISRQSRS